MGRKCFLMCFCLMVISAPVCASGFLDTYGLGQRSISMGGAFCAVADDFSATYHNPAGLGQLTGNSISMEFMYLSPDIKVDKLDGSPLVIYTPQGEVRTNPLKYRGGSNLSLKVPTLGMHFDLNNLLNLPFNMQLGALECLPERNDVMYRIYSYPADQPHMIRYGSDIDRLELNFALGMELVPQLFYFGAGVQSMIYGDGSVYFDGLTTANGPQYSHIVSQVDYNIMNKYYPIVGILITPLDQKLKIGFSWRDYMDVEIDPVSNIITTDLGVDLAMVLGLNAYYTPEEYTLGIAYDFDNFLVSFQIDRQLWSKYSYSPQDAVYFPGSPDFKDTTNLRLGVEYRLSDDTSIMFGYTHQPTPVPDQTDRISNYIDMDKDMVSLGFSQDLHFPSVFSKPLTVGGFVQYQKLDSYTVTKDNAPQGITWINQESYTVEGSSIAAGMSVSVNW